MDLTDDDWIKFNVGQYGYYRVQYPIAEWQRFSQFLQSKPEQMTSSDRTSLINDAFALAKAGQIPYGTALDLTRYLGSGERFVAPWETAFLALDTMADVLYYTPVFRKLNDYLASLVQEPYEELGWDIDPSDPVERLMLRSFVLRKMCTFGTASKMAGDLLLNWKNNDVEIHPDLRDIVYAYGMKDVGNLEIWQWMLNKYVTESNAQEKLKLLRGLTSIGQPWILNDLLEMARNESVIRNQDYFTLLTYMSWNRVGEPIVWDFVRNNWPYLVDRFTLNNRLMARMVAEVTKKFATELRRKEMQDFFQKYPDAGAGANYRKIALETVRNNVLFLQENIDVIENWLNQ